MKFRPDIEALILGVLVESSEHGYNIVKQILARSDGYFKLGEGQLYPVLHRMEMQSLIVSEWENPETGPARKVYSLTASGKAELAVRRKNWSKFVGNVNSVLTTSEVSHGKLS